MEQEDKDYLIRTTISSQEEALDVSEVLNQANDEFDKLLEGILNNGLLPQAIETFRDFYFVHQDKYETPKWKVAFWFYAFMSKVKFETKMGNKFWEHFNYNQQKQIDKRAAKARMRNQAVIVEQASPYESATSKSGVVKHCKFRANLPNDISYEDRMKIAKLRGSNFSISREDVDIGFDFFAANGGDFYSECTSAAQISIENIPETPVTKAYFDEKFTEIKNLMNIQAHNQLQLNTQHGQTMDELNQAKIEAESFKKKIISFLQEFLSADSAEYQTLRDIICESSDTDSNHTSSSNSSQSLSENPADYFGSQPTTINPHQIHLQQQNNNIEFLN